MRIIKRFIDDFKTEMKNTQSKRDFFRKIKNDCNLYDLYITQFDFYKIPSKPNVLFFKLFIYNKRNDITLGINAEMTLDNNNTACLLISCSNNRILEENQRIKTPLYHTFKNALLDFPSYYFKENKNKRLLYLLSGKRISINSSSFYFSEEDIIKIEENISNSLKKHNN